MVGDIMATRGGGKKRGRSRKDAQEITQVNNVVSPSSKITTQIIRTPDDLGNFTYGSTLKRRVTDQHTESTQISGRNLSPILRTPEIVDKDHSDSHVGADFGNSTLQQLRDAPTHVFNSALQLKSVSHTPKGAAKEVTVDGKLKCASVTGAAGHKECRISQSIIPSVRGFEDLNFSENSFNSVQALAGNLQTNSYLPSSMNTPHLKNKDKMELANNSEESRNVVEEMGGDGLFEADSQGPNNALVPVKGYKVKSHHVGLLNSIISRHGDIGADCSMISVKFRSTSMEHVCELVLSLKKTKLKSITDKELDSMMDMVTDLERVKVDVGWLRKRLEDISEAKKYYAKLKPGSDLKLHTEKLSKVENIKQELEEYKRVLLDLQQKVNSAETALSVADTELTETQNLISEISATARRIFSLESLDYDLV